MIKHIKQIIDQLIIREGGYVNLPDDQGGPTQYGITLKTLEYWYGHTVTADDVKNLSKNTAADIYYSKYYIQPGINNLPEQLYEFMLDAAVHHGPKHAIQILQETLLRNGANVGPIDGYIGPVTLRAAEQQFQQHGNQLINQMINTRIGFVERIVKFDETQRTFLPGWIARIESLKPEELA